MTAACGVFALVLMWCCTQCCIAVRYCQGTDHGTVGGSSNPGERFRDCTHIEGDLVIIDIPWDPPSYDDSYAFRPPSSASYDFFDVISWDDIDLSALSSIVEVSGYVHVASVDRYVPLHNLRIIRGESTLSGDALVVTGSTFRLSSLREITQGGVRFSHTNFQCILITINWGDLQPELEPVLENTGKEHCERAAARKPICHGDCPAGCWGPDRQDCQTETLSICDESCDGRCRGPGPDDCCHGECAGGCSDGTPSGCYSCRNLVNGAECVNACPPMLVYNPETFFLEMNPNFRYQYGRHCVETCPDGLFGEDEFCVESCSAGYMEVDSECIRCDGLCPKECTGLALREYLTGDHFDNGRFTNCTRIQGNILINADSLNGDIFNGIAPVSFSDLDLFRTVREITGYLVIITPDHRFSTLDFLQSIEVIGGEGDQFAHRSGSTSRLYAFILDVAVLQVADFRSLRSVGGSINYVDTCYHTREMFTELLTDPSDAIVVKQEKTACVPNPCDQECTDIGCWGAESNQCFRCRNARSDDGTCIPSCDLESHYVISPGNATTTEVCGPCHAECSGGCTGPLNTECSECQNFIFGPFCVSECTDDQYVNDQRACQICPDFCQHGCTGPEHLIGVNGCNHCDFVLLDHEGTFMRCMGSSESCPRNHVVTEFPDPYASSTVCQSCDPQCKGGCMRGGDPSSCAECHRHIRGDTCVKKCTSSEYSDHDKICRSCDPSCLECNNNTAQDCTECKHLMVPLDGDKMECVSECPDGASLLHGMDTCVTECPEDHFTVDDEGICIPCHPVCSGGCTDGTNKGCITCDHVILDDSCVEECPEDFEDRNGTCVRTDKTTGTGNGASPVKILLLVLIVIGLLLGVLVVAIVIVVRRRRTRSSLNLNNVDLQELPHGNGKDNVIA